MITRTLFAIIEIKEGGKEKLINTVLDEEEAKLRVDQLKITGRNARYQKFTEGGEEN